MTDTAVTHKPQLVGNVSVDSGQVIIVDPCYIMDGEYDEAPVHDPKDHKVASYGHPCAVTLSDEQVGEFPVKGFATSVASSSGYGDGNYPVYATKNEDGRVSELTIYFDEDPNTGELPAAAQMMKGMKAMNEPVVRTLMDFLVEYDEDGQPEGLTEAAFEQGFTADDIIRLQELIIK